MNYFFTRKVIKVYVYEYRGGAVFVFFVAEIFRLTLVVKNLDYKYF